MEYQFDNKILGVHEGISYGQNERTNELNDRIYSRSFPDIPLAANFDPRPVPTKYSLFPIINRRTSATVPIQPSINHHVELNFNPGTYNAPPLGYIENIDIETGLRNQTVALQHGAHQGVYIPSSNSDLYNVKIPSIPGPPQPHPDLFSRESYKTSFSSNLENNKIGYEKFHNNTRTQLRNL